MNYFQLFRILGLSTLMLSSSCLINAQTPNTGIASYKGVPKSDTQFPQFLKKNHNKVVQLDLTIKNPNEFDDITYGYRGVSPTFYVADLGKTSYEVYIDCDQINHPNSQNTIDHCSPYVKWNTQTGRLTGKFKVVSKGKNAVGGMLYYLVAVK
ncbi:hypothetical protein [Acinetobacter ursingii]|uniref:hypothetical protein n=1 Tax=Acinetobacter ursingii TaxID=108980 RepID=UPI000667F1C2|nr:hypothetical protein [Acinetobacter ursingii]MCH2004378.1 hypothetical protein [Acinetobacter ursingii]